MIKLFKLNEDRSKERELSYYLLYSPITDKSIILNMCDLYGEKIYERTPFMEMPYLSYFDEIEPSKITLYSSDQFKVYKIDNLIIFSYKDKQMCIEMDTHKIRYCNVELTNYDPLYKINLILS